MDLDLGVDPEFSAIQSACGRSATGGWRQAAQPVLTFAVSGTVDAAQVASIFPRLARPSPAWRLRIQPQVGEDLLDDLPLQDDEIRTAGVSKGSAVPVRPGRNRSFTASSPPPNAVYPDSKVKLSFEKSIVECPVMVAADVQTAGGE